MACMTCRAVWCAKRADTSIHDARSVAYLLLTDAQLPLSVCKGFVGAGHCRCITIAGGNWSSCGRIICLPCSSHLKNHGKVCLMYHVPQWFK